MFRLSPAVPGKSSAEAAESLQLHARRTNKDVVQQIVVPIRTRTTPSPKLDASAECGIQGQGCDIGSECIE